MRSAKGSGSRGEDGLLSPRLEPVAQGASEVFRKDLEIFFGGLLRTGDFQDFGPNGLQVEGRSEIRRIAFSVSATQHSVSEAVRLGVDALIVHHGIFWEFQPARPVVGPFARRLIPLIRHEINLFAYHLPLDAHPEIGNAAVLGKRIGLQELEPFGVYKGMPMGVRGRLNPALAAANLRDLLSEVLEHPVLFASPGEHLGVTSIGIITGGASREWREAVRVGLDAYVTGEMSEHDWHESQEAGIHMFAGGHHATEVFGVMALMELVRSEFSLECVFIPSQNPA